MSAAALQAHLASGATHVCHCWAIQRRDGVVQGFTDHDRLLAFDGITFSPDSGLTARALASTTGLSVDNTEAIGALTADSITEADIDAGRYDAAEVTTWMVCWDDVAARQVRFFGTIGEITRASGGFQAELRGLADALNQPQGRSYLRSCSAVLGDGRCGFDTAAPGFSVEVADGATEDGQVFRLQVGDGFNDRWFEGGVLEVLSGDAAGLSGVIKHDVIDRDARVITLWQTLRAGFVAGDTLRLMTGCDKRSETCRVKFSNLVNFQGFPDIPGEDWLISVPRSGDDNGGGSRRT